ncbi:MAG: MerR family transcriptional regulator [Ghiorsea sp.]
MDEKKALFPIRHISEVTGVLTVTLRAWERRYGLLKPQRTSKGHRLYSEYDIDRVRQVLSLLNKGMAIGQVRQVLDDKTKKPSAAQDEGIEAQQAGLEKAALALDSQAVAQLIYNIGAVYPLAMMDARLIRPVLHRLQQSDSVYQKPAVNCLKESVYMAMIKRKSSALKKVDNPSLLFMAMTDKFSCLSYELAQVAAMENGLSVLALGHHLHVSMLADIALEKKAVAIVLWSDEEPERGWENDIRALRSKIKTAIMMGGELATRQSSLLTSLDIQPLPLEIDAYIKVLKNDIRTK